MTLSTCARAHEDQPAETERRALPASGRLAGSDGRSSARRCHGGRPSKGHSVLPHRLLHLQGPCNPLGTAFPLEKENQLTRPMLIPPHSPLQSDGSTQRRGHDLHAGDGDVAAAAAEGEAEGHLRAESSLRRRAAAPPWSFGPGPPGPPGAKVPTRLLPGTGFPLNEPGTQN